MLLLDLIENSNILCNKIINESNKYNNTYIKKFQDIKNITIILDNIINIRRIWQKTILQLDNSIQTIQNNINNKEKLYNKELNKFDSINNKINNYSISKRKCYEHETNIIYSPLLRNNTIKDNTIKDNIKKDNTTKDNIKKDNIKKDNIKKDNIKKDNIKKDNTKKDNTKKDDTKKDNITDFTVIKYNNNNKNYKLSKPICIDMGFDNLIKLQLYEYKEDIPELSYGIIKNNIKLNNQIKYIILYRISKKSFVSCNIGKISLENKNIRTVLCNNIPYCKYNNSCTYYHSPLYYPDTNHTRFFFKTPLCPKDPSFGDGLLFKQQKKILKFTDVNTLASDCAIKLLQIRLLCQEHSI